MSKEKVLNAMKEAGKPLRPGEIADIAKMESAEVSKFIKQLKTEGKVYSPKRCYYSPK